MASGTNPNGCESEAAPTLALWRGLGNLDQPANKSAGVDFSQPDYFIMDGDGRWARP